MVGFRPHEVSWFGRTEGAGRARSANVSGLPTFRAVIFVIVAAVVSATAETTETIMPKNNSNETILSPEPTLSREQMVQLLNEDLAREYQAVIAYTVYSQMLKGPEYMDIAAELETHATEELQHALKIARQIDYFGGVPGVVPKPVKVTENPEEMLRADLENERETVAQYRQRIRQAEAMGEFALSETLREIIIQEQDHEMDLADALGIQVPEPKQISEERFASAQPLRRH